MQAICVTSSDGYRRYGLALKTDAPTGMLFVHWDAQHERLADLPQTTRSDWQRYGPRQGRVRLDEEQRHDATLQLVDWDELPDHVQGQLRRLAERMRDG